VTAPNAPLAEIEMVREGTRRLLRSIEQLSDVDVAQPCLLPGWSRAELVTHLARNADGFRHIAEAAARGEVADQYPGGNEQRAADIAAGRGKRARAVVTDVRRASDALSETWSKLPADAWSGTGRVVGGARRIDETVGRRLREVEIHHVDLGLEYTPADWPVTFVRPTLDEAVATLPERAAPHRPDLHARFRLEASDHACAWVVVLDGRAVAVDRDDGARADVDAVVTGWGCDLLAWLYGRGAAGTLSAAGRDSGVLHLSRWFPYS
jgi:maleylpyruvate isomerase